MSGNLLCLGIDPCSCCNSLLGIGPRMPCTSCLRILRLTPILLPSYVERPRLKLSMVILNKVNTFVLAILLDEDISPVKAILAFISLKS